jgi:hypothetical protein
MSNAAEIAEEIRRSGVQESENTKCGPAPGRIAPETGRCVDGDKAMDRQGYTIERHIIVVCTAIATVMITAADSAHAQCAHDPGYRDGGTGLTPDTYSEPQRLPEFEYGPMFNNRVYGVGERPVDVATDDLNGDGHADVVTANWASHDITVLFGNADGTLSVGDTYDVGGLPSSVLITDMNADGDPDVILADYSNATVTVLMNSGQGALVRCC